MADVDTPATVTSPQEATGHDHLPPQPADSKTDSQARLTSAFSHQLSLATKSIHADDYINSHRAVAPPLHVSTTFRYSNNPDDLGQLQNIDPAAPYDSHVYSRHTAPNSTRLEALLSAALGGPALTYSSGLAAFHALLVFLNPRRIAIGGGYHGCHGVIRLLAKLSGLEALTLEPADLARLQKGDVLHVETPLNPTGEARDLGYYGRVAREKGCYFTVDGTFAPPPLQEPFEFGVDVVMHSGTKYLGGHSDMLCGVLVVRPEREERDGWVGGLMGERLFLGSVAGSLEGWLGVRSLRTLELRVERQSESVGRLVGWLAGELGREGSTVAKVVERVQHASLQPEAKEEGSWLRKQMPRGYGPVFAIWMKDEDAARSLPSKLMLFHHATSLGGVESLIEWRAMTDRTVDTRLLRVSVGVEGWEDLKADLKNGFRLLSGQREKLTRRVDAEPVRTFTVDRGFGEGADEA